MHGPYLLCTLLQSAKAPAFPHSSLAGFMSIQRGMVTARKMAEVCMSLAHLGRIIMQLQVRDILIPHVMVSQGE